MRRGESFTVLGLTTDSCCRDSILCSMHCIVSICNLLFSGIMNYSSAYNWHHASQMTFLLRDLLSLSRSFVLWPQPWSLSTIMLLWHSFLVITVIIMKSVKIQMNWVLICNLQHTVWDTVHARHTQDNARSSTSLLAYHNRQVTGINSWTELKLYWYLFCILLYYSFYFITDVITNRYPDMLQAVVIWNMHDHNTVKLDDGPSQQRF